MNFHRPKDVFNVGDDRGAHEVNGYYGLVLE